MNDVDYDVDKIENILKLMKIFFYGFPNILKILLAMISRMNYDEEISAHHANISPVLNHLNAQILSVDDFFNLSVQHFDGERKKGVIKFFNESKGFGFIEREKEEDLHVSKKNITEIIKEGDKVEFLIGKGKKGPEARQVRKI
jgi:CspA family cold shock protein